jgi:hypothetical protein
VRARFVRCPAGRQLARREAALSPERASGAASSSTAPCKTLSG